MQNPELQNPQLQNPQLQNILDIVKSACAELYTTISNNNPMYLSIPINYHNNSNDDVIIVDIIANQIFHNELSRSPYIRGIVSEEDNEATYYPLNKNAPYFVAFDPIDGSKNIKNNISTGTIFCIFKYPEYQQNYDNYGIDIDTNKVESGRNIVCSGYCLYGLHSQLLISTKQSTNLYHYNIASGTYELSIPNIQLKDSPSKSYCINQGYYYLWENNGPIQKYVEYQKRKHMSLRFVGSMVADVHRAIMNGGNFLYPANNKNKNGRLRLLYEVYPMSFIFENIGGVAVNDDNVPILDTPFPSTNLHQRSSILLFNQSDYQEYLGLQEHPVGDLPNSECCKECPQ